MPDRIPLDTVDEHARPAPAEPEPTSAAEPASGPVEPAELEKRIVAKLQTIFDPEIPVNIHELGLIYGIDIAPEGAVAIRMTLTSPSCPAAASLPSEVRCKTAAVPGVASVQLDLVWEPPWDPSRMSEASRLELGIEY
jgi:FeS assembly SUF system protein